MLCGTARLVMCLAEVPFFYLSGPLIRKIGVRWVIAMTELAYLVRFLYYSVSLSGYGASSRQAWLSIISWNLELLRVLSNVCSLVE